ncbi:hypothetical protein FQN54_005991 [Arachnomyces sp. PD_36]|nr:hypothetical protein FQN54_005991 [Arachnomyces sp. PD_36]
MALGKRARERSPATELPLIERVNALPLQQFIEQYIPQEALGSSISIPRTLKEAEDRGDSDNGTLNELPQHYSLDIHSSKSIPESDFDACFNLIKLTSSEAYKHSTVGWSRAKKRSEMKLLDMKYILLRRLQPKESNSEAGQEKGVSDVEGFLSFMVTYEDEVEVIYCYEIHLSPSIQNKGLGKRLIGLYEAIGRNVGLEKAMLTVFRSNEMSRRFYEKLGYEEDEFSPRPKRLRNGVVKEPDYIILSKSLQREDSEHETTNRETKET